MNNGVDERMDYPMVEEMSQRFAAANQKIKETQAEMASIAEMMQNGVLLGQTGDAFVNALRVDLNGALETLGEKLNELSQDLNAAVQAKRDGVKTARTRFV